MSSKLPGRQDPPTDPLIEQKLRELFAPVEQEPIPQEWLDMLNDLKDSKVKDAETPPARPEGSGKAK